MLSYGVFGGGYVMKRFEYRFNYKPEIKNHILNKIELCLERDEDKILNLLFSGLTTEAVAIETGYSYRTICRRKKDLNNKIKTILYQ